MPTPLPTLVPTLLPSPVPTLQPTPVPTSVPTLQPTPVPTLVPSPLPTISCEPGYYYDADAIRCTQCETGKYLNATFAPWPTECTQCETGRVAVLEGMINCKDCGAGKFAQLDGKACATCRPGQFVNNSACNPCSPGRYAPSYVTGQCFECGTGFATAGWVLNNKTEERLGATSCEECLAGERKERARP